MPKLVLNNQEIETRQTVNSIPMGSVTVTFEKPKGLMFDLTAWRAATTVRCYVVKEERGS